jgi:hypothetical protein
MISAEEYQSDAHGIAKEANGCGYHYQHSGCALQSQCSYPKHDHTYSPFSKVGKHPFTCDIMGVKQRDERHSEENGLQIKTSEIKGSSYMAGISTEIKFPLQ